MSPGKSPGIDGISAMFYQQNWDLVGNLVAEAVLGVLNDGADPTKLNRTIITLIPKIKKPQTMKDYRPISLCNVISKLITKVLNRTSGRKGIVSLKLDMSKAFDRVEWCFIEEVMRKMGFAEQWIRLIMTCLSTNTFSFTINGEISGSLTPTRGLRQGCPLFPYLFLICSEGLSRMLQHEELAGRLTGFKLTRNASPISHLFFADDSLLFCHANESSCLAIKRVLDIYHRASWQLLNYDKSVMSFCPNTTLAAQVFFHRTLSMHICECHEKYLGLPSYTGRDKQQIFSDIKEKIWRLMHNWNEKLFSAGGREVLLKAVVQAIPTYIMSYFRLPVTICNQLESMMANFCLVEAFLGLKTPQKVKIFAWRVIHNALPVATSLVRRKIITDSTCSVCKSAWESIGHALFSCRYANAVWQKMNLFFDWKRASSMYKGDYLVHLSTVYTQQEMELIICTLWSIWMERNRIVHGSKAKPAVVLASFADNYLTNYRAARNKYHVADPLIHHQPRPPEATPPWQPPAAGDLKLNVDAAVDATRKITGIGAVVRDSAGVVRAALAKPIIGNFASHEMEAKAIFYSLNWVLQLQMPIAIVETDALLVANAIRNGSSAITSYSDLIIDVISLLSFFPQVNVVHAKRSTNMVAHILAKFALWVDETCSWLEDLPLSFYSVIDWRSFRSEVDRDDRGWTLLHVGARKGDINQVKRLLDNGMDVNVPTWGPKSKGATPLHLAAEGGHLSVMDELLERGANIDARTKGACGWTPLHNAAKERRRAAVKFLVENGAFLPPDINDCRFNPPLHYCPGLDWAYEELERLQQESLSSGETSSSSEG
uniref:Reverse transcriptase domain-containing protein n=2 Tax=Cannabis sativa TaxID=3483 RepID=A0A803QHU3_CANSA